MTREREADAESNGSDESILEQMTAGDTSLPRRRVLAGLAAASVTGLAGCSGATDRRFEAEPVGISADDAAALGLEAAAEETITNEYERSIGDEDVSAEVTSHAVRYEATGGEADAASDVGRLRTTRDIAPPEVLVSIPGEALLQTEHEDVRRDVLDVGRLLFPGDMFVSDGEFVGLGWADELSKLTVMIQDGEWDEHDLDDVDAVPLSRAMEQPDEGIWSEDFVAVEGEALERAVSEAEVGRLLEHSPVMIDIRGTFVEIIGDFNDENRELVEAGTAFFPGGMWFPGDTLFPGGMWFPGDTFFPGDMFSPGDTFFPGGMWSEGSAFVEGTGGLEDHHDDVAVGRLDLLREGGFVLPAGSWEQVDENDGGEVRTGPVDTTFSTGAFSTPTAEVLGQSLNPLADKSRSALLTDDDSREIVGRLGIDGVENGWVATPRSDTETVGRLVGEETTIETFAGIAGSEAAPEFALVHVARVETGDDTVVATAAESWAVDEIRGVFVGDDGYVGGREVEASIRVALDVFEAVLYGEDATDEETEAGQPARIAMDEVPEPIRQRATAIIDEFSGDHPELWARAELGDEAYPVSRPDVDGVAYYDLEVEPEGYVLCATDRHDHPVPNLGTEGTSIGRYLESEADEPVENVVWLDRQRFVAENANGDVVATRGNNLYRIEGLDELAEHDETVEIAAGPGDDGPATDEEVARNYEPTVEFRNDSRPSDDVPLSSLLDGASDELSAEAVHDELPFDTWDSHEQIKENYEEAYRPVLADLRERAREHWERLEEEQAQVRQAGVGGTGSERHVDSVFDAAAVQPSGDKSWAGGWGEQVYYFQFLYDGWSDECQIGCGAVAWALLFGWADRQADGGQYDDTWWPRWGLYREDGGKGDDEVAPDASGASPGGPEQPDGVKNMIEELNDDLYTFCNPLNWSDDPSEIGGATHPWQMYLADRYFAGRTGTTLKIRSNGASLPGVRMKWLARDSIRGDRSGKGPTPAIIGTGIFNHYPLAYAFSDGGTFGWDYFKVNNAWSDHHPNKSEWVWAPTWFAGTIHPDWD